MKNNEESYADFVTEYIFDKSGNKTKLILSLEAFEQFIDDIEDYIEGQIAEAALQDREGSLSHAEFMNLISKSTKYCF